MIRPNRRICLTCRLPGRFARDARGAVSIIAALLMVLGLGLAAMVMDTGRLYLEKRRLQAAVDAAALAAVADTGQASSLAARSLVTNGYDGTATVVTGTYSADPSAAENSRFASGTTPPNAVRVTKTVSSAAFLAAIFNGGGNSDVQATATAAQIPAVAFAAGTGLGTLSGGQLNQVLSGLFGTTLTVTLPNYNALAAANIDTLTFLDQLAAQAGVTAGTYGDLANTSVTLGQVLAAARTTLNIQGGDNGAALDALSVLSVQLPQSATMLLGQAVNLTLWQKRDIGSVAQQKMGQTNVNLFDLMSAMARAYGAGHLANLATAISLPVTGTGTATRLAVGSPMASIGLSPVGTHIATSQVRMSFTTTLLNTTLAGYPVQVNLPVYLQIASGDAMAAAIPCTAGGVRATIDATPQGGFAKIGTVTDADFTNFAADPPVSDANGAGATVLGITIAFKTTGGITILPGDSTPLDFTQDLIDNGTPKTAFGSDAGHVFSRLANSMTVTANFSGAGVLTGTINTILNNTLTPLVKALLVSIVTALDPATDTLLRALGLRLGEIDVVVHGVSCGTPTLVH